MGSPRVTRAEPVKPVGNPRVTYKPINFREAQCPPIFVDDIFLNSESLEG